MSYLDWFNSHYKKHKSIMQKLAHLSDDEVIEYFSFENMLKSEPDFCPLYSKGKKCHEIEDLNCYMCGCPYFRFDDDGIKKDELKVIKSICSIDAKDSSQIEHNGVVHLNCSFCLLPHKKSFIKKHFSRDWREMMQDVAKF